MRTMIRRWACFSKRIPGQLAGLFLLLFAGLTGLVLAGAMDGIDLRVSRAVENADHPALTTLLGRATEAAMPLVLLLVIPVGGALLRRRARIALLIVSSALGSSA